MNNVTCGMVCTARCKRGYVPVDGRADDTEELFVCGRGVWDRVTSKDEHGSTTAPFECRGENPPDPNAKFRHPPAGAVDDAVQEASMPIWTFDPVASFLEMLLGKKSVEIQITKDIGCTEAAKAKHGDKLTVHYIGTVDGSELEFDNSYTRNTPFTFRVGAGQVIPGWDQGAVGMCVGEQRTVTVPPHLGYGNADRPKIPPQSTLVFRIELLALN